MASRTHGWGIEELGTEIKIGGEEHLILREEDVLGIVE